MPTYEYRCADCGELTEAFQKMSDAPLTTCPHCGHESLKRVVSGGAGVIYKGEGWYVTDYSKKSSGGKDVDSKKSSTSTPTSPSKSETSSPDAPKTETPKPASSSGRAASSSGESAAAKTGS
jgi:putative FmdB family regulatory protein